MTSLIERCHRTNEDLLKVEVARRTAHVRLQVQERTNEWNEHLGRLSVAIERARWAGVTPSEVPAFASKREQLGRIAAEASARLKEDSDVTHLTADALWTRLLQSAAGAAEALEEATKTSWQAFVQQQGSFAAPIELEAKITPTPANRQALASYLPHFAAYKRLATAAVPRSAQDKAALEMAAELCRVELAKLDYDVPSEIADFFRAVNANTATLSIVTPEVLRWLRESGQIHRYVVRSFVQ